MTGTDNARVTAVVRGRVQGVGFRWWTREQADELGVVGSARNHPDGTVEVVAEGSRRDVERLVQRLEGPVAGRPGRVEAVAVSWEEATGTLSGFTAE